MAVLLPTTQTSLRTQGAAWVAKLRMRMLCEMLYRVDVDAVLCRMALEET
jgi:hypothetical protein